MKSCPSSVSNLSIVLGGGRSLREVGCVDESASRSFGTSAQTFGQIYLSGGNRTVVQAISRGFLVGQRLLQLVLDVVGAKPLAID
jgi:hypothetical protein